MEEPELRSFDLLMACGQAEEACIMHNTIQETIAGLAPRLELAAPAVVAVMAATVESLALNLALNAREQEAEWDDLGARMEIIAVISGILLAGYTADQMAGGMSAWAHNTERKLH